jgi:DNA modification methylase
MANKMKSKQANNQPWQNRIVEYCEMSPAELPENPRNWRTHPEKQRKALAGALGEIGLVQSVVFNRRTGRLVDGHLRVAMAREAGQEKVPVVVVDLSENEEAVILATIDPLAALAEIDVEKLDGLLRETKTCSADLQELLAGLADSAGLFTDKAALVEAHEPDVDAAEELARKWGTERGQIWIVGDHRLICGDSTSRADVDRVLGGGWDFMVTSPPYNVGVKYDSHDDNNVDWSAYEKFLIDILDASIPSMKEGRCLAWNIGTSPKTHHVRQHLLLEDRYHLSYYRQMVWKKVAVPVPLWFNTTKNPRARQFTPNYQHEVVLIFTKGQLERGDPVAVDALCENDVFEYAQSMATVDLPSGSNRTGAQSNLDRRSKKAHPAAFPVRIPAMFITHLSAPGEIVYEPFSGSGTTLVACEQLGRRCRAIEISPAYVAVALERWSEMTGKTPVLA